MKLTVRDRIRLTVAQAVTKIQIRDKTKLTVTGARGPLPFKLGAPLSAFIGKFFSLAVDGIAYPSNGTGADIGLRTDLAENGGVWTGVLDDRVGGVVKPLNNFFIGLGKVRLLTKLSAAELTAVATQSGAYDISPKIAYALADARAQGAVEIDLGPGLLPISQPITSVPTGTRPFEPGLRLVGAGGMETVIRPTFVGGSRTTSAAIHTDTTVSGTFQRKNVFEGFCVDMTEGSTAHQASRDAFYCQRTYAARWSDVQTIGGRDAIYNPVISNDNNSSNSWEVDSDCYFYAGVGWAFHHDPYAGANDLSYLRFQGQVVHFGTDELRAITAITAVSPTYTRITAVGHDLVNGEIARIDGILTGPSALNGQAFVVVREDADHYGIAIDTTSATPWSAGGFSMRAEPKSGGLRLNPQMALVGQQGYITESFNVGVLIPGPTPAYKTEIGRFTIENQRGYSIIANGSDGLSILRNDLRVNGAVGGGINQFGAVMLDASRYPVVETVIRENTIIAINCTVPHTAYNACGAVSNGGHTLIEGTAYKAYADEVGSPKKKYGDGLFGFASIEINEDSRKIFKPEVNDSATLSGASPAMVLDARTSPKKFRTLASGVTGTVTIPVPVRGLLSGTALNGVEIELTLYNAGASAVALDYAIGVYGTGPASIAAGSVLTIPIQFRSALGWFVPKRLV